jgi:hypothetical protein
MDMQSKGSILDIVHAAGGARAVAAEITKRSGKGKPFTSWAVYRWNKHGVPDEHWPVLIEMAGTTPDELFKANEEAREKLARGVHGRDLGDEDAREAAA